MLQYPAEIRWTFVIKLQKQHLKMTDVITKLFPVWISKTVLAVALHSTDRI